MTITHQFKKNVADCEAWSVSGDVLTCL